MLQILHIDDDDDDRYFFGLALSKCDESATLTSERGSESALKKLADGRISKPDLIVLDWNMPKIGGKNCLRGIRKIEGFSDIKIIIFTTSHDPDDRLEAESMGAKFFSKPCTSESITAQVREMLGVS